MASQAFKLSRPLQYEGKTYDILTLDIDSLSFGDLENIKEEAALLAKTPTADIDLLVSMITIGRAVKLPIEAVRLLSMADGMKLTGIVNGFLLSMG